MNTLPALEPSVEPWLRGTHAEVPPVGRAVLHALDLASEDLKKWTNGLTDAEAHGQPLGLPALAFHLRHIARSVDRLLSFAEGKQLSAEQLTALKAEQGDPQERRKEPLLRLLAEVDAAFANAAERVRELARTDLDAAVAVGRKQLPSTVGGALVHVADHTQRHVGQVVTTCRLLKELRG